MVSGTVNGIAFSNIIGTFGEVTFVLGSNYHLLSSVTIAGGTLTATGSQPGTFSGIEGIQIVPITDVPEPGTLAIFAPGFAGLGFKRRRKLS